MYVHDIANGLFLYLNPTLVVWWCRAGHKEVVVFGKYVYVL